MEVGDQRRCIGEGFGLSREAEGDGHDFCLAEEKSGLGIFIST